jgi:type 1 glutamine amidotransferase
MLAVLLIATLGVAAQSEPPKMNILVFSKTAGFRHDSIPAGHEMFKELAAKNDFSVESTEDASLFNTARLAAFDAVVFMNTTGNVLDETQQQAFEAFIRSGKGFVGIHAASDTEYEWPWFGKLVGAYFRSHPHIQDAEIKVEDPKHPTMRAWTESPFRRKDEWYDFRDNPRSEVKVLASLNTKSYEGSKMGDDHPIIWCREFDGGRTWYTGFGHTKETYAEPQFRQMIVDALRWVTTK